MYWHQKVKLSSFNLLRKYKLKKAIHRQLLDFFLLKDDHVDTPCHLYNIEITD